MDADLWIFVMICPLFVQSTHTPLPVTVQEAMTLASSIKSECKFCCTVLPLQHSAVCAPRPDDVIIQTNPGASRICPTGATNLHEL